MIKKLLLSSLALAGFALNAQNLKVDGSANLDRKISNRFETNSMFAEKSSNVAAAVVQDTLWYFFNKHYYRNPAPGNLQFITVKNAAVITGSSQIASFGSVFKNTGTIAITGLEALLSRQSNATSTSVPVGLFLYNAPSGTITGVPIASVSAVITGTAPTYVGGNFALPSLVSGDYAVIARNISTVVSDTIRLWINNALTSASTGGSNSAKYGESFGFVGIGTVANTFLSTTGSFATGTVGAVSDYEGIVAPRVTYSTTTSASVPLNTICPNVAITYTNTSSSWIGHRQYNLNQFLAQLAPFSFTGTPVGMPVYSWAFGDGSPSFTTTGTNILVAKTYTVAGTFNGTLTANIRKMNDSGFSLTDAGNFSKSVSVCTGLKANTLNADILVYPNPAVNGKLIIANLEGNNTITIYNMLGAIISTQTTTNTNVAIDLTNQAIGNYFVKITDINSNTKTLKVINQ